MSDNPFSENPPFTTVFIGNTGNGKTSILSAMYMTLDKANLPCGLSLLTQTTDDFQLLQNKWREMKRHIRSQGFGTTIQKPMYQGSQGFTKHDFVLTGDASDTQSDIPLRIWDTAGGFTARTDQKLIDLVAQSFNVMCAVDATFLMECDSDVNEEMNEVHSIKQILERALRQSNNGILSVIFLLTKCEKYMQDDKRRDEMAAKFNREFRSVLELLRQNQIMVHYLPVQTMGCVELARMEESADGRNWDQYFQAIIGKEFDASDAVQPLSLVIQTVIYLLDLARQFEWENRTIFEKIWDTITFKDAPARLDGLVSAIAKHFGSPKDWRSNNRGELAEVVPVE